ncbi:hypothetical protein BOTBODRAFT_179339 [Botryobasidium botryosum FD-172 SS1]|uniref:Uncharacterized protein n=1 Tax=Botryobasidium botryosum (strain FD-172 SS1) TaxID=930990 RepID=A0A067M2Q6_BOTB1|nr:hypothetical protein BOTBODRAFT_179339 [Botryobasidium botryosum FD-172 SS1]
MVTVYDPAFLGDGQVPDGRAMGKYEGASSPPPIEPATPSWLGASSQGPSPPTSLTPFVALATDPQHDMPLPASASEPLLATNNLTAQINSAKGAARTDWLASVVACACSRYVLSTLFDEHLDSFCLAVVQPSSPAADD